MNTPTNYPLLNKSIASRIAFNSKQLVDDDSFRLIREETQDGESFNQRREQSRLAREQSEKLQTALF
jgi:hypothetical protein